MKYMLEYYMPGDSGYDVVHRVESDTPFMTIRPGDLINTLCWPTRNRRELNDSREGKKFRYGAVLKVTRLEHFVFQVGEDVTGHKVGVFSEAIEDTAEARQLAG